MAAWRGADQEADEGDGGMIDALVIESLTEQKARYRENAAQGAMMVLEEWDPDKRPVHCSNCRHCLVSGDWPHPEAKCARGHGARPHIPLVRKVGIRKASACPDFDSMSDDA